MRATVSSSSNSYSSAGSAARAVPAARLGAGADDHEDRLATLEPHLDGGAVELVGDLGRGLGERVHQGEPDGRVEGHRQPLGGGADLVAAGLGGLGEVSAETLDELRDVHGQNYDTTMVSRQHHTDETLS